MSEPKIRRTRNGARLPADQATPRYLGENIEKDLREVSERADGGTMQSRILVAAIALFAERGYENLNMRTLAGWVGLKAPTLYNYYASKEQLLVEAIELGMTDFFSYILEGIDDVPREQRLFEIVHRHAGYKMRHRLIARANDRLIDLAVLRLHEGKSDEAMCKAEAAYPVREPLRKALVKFQGSEEYRDKCFSALQIADRAMVIDGVDLLAADCGLEGTRRSHYEFRREF